MKYFLTLFFILIFTAAYAADPLEDEFNGVALGGDWTTNSEGTITVTGGNLQIVRSGTDVEVYQSNIIGDFDIYATFGGTHNTASGNSDLGSANENMTLIAAVGVGLGGDNRVEIEQNSILCFVKDH